MKLLNSTPEGKYKQLIADLNKANIPNNFSLQEYLSLKDHVCEYCSLDRNHCSIVPRDLNSGYVSDNLQPVCEKCKKSKLRSESPESFQRKMLRRYGMTPEKKEYLSSLVGQKFNLLTVLEIGECIRGHFKLLCQCDCGNKKWIRNDVLLSGQTKSCGCLQRKNIGRNPIDFCLGKKCVKQSQNSKNVFNSIKRRANYRNIGFSVTYEEFEKFYGKNCYYCNKENCIGLDRIDSSRGYLIDNIVTCCTLCNSMKNVLTQEDFYNHVRKIKDHLEL